MQTSNQKFSYNKSIKVKVKITYSAGAWRAPLLACGLSLFRVLLPGHIYNFLHTLTAVI